MVWFEKNRIGGKQCFYCLFVMVLLFYNYLTQKKRRVIAYENIQKSHKNTKEHFLSNFANDKSRKIRPFCEETAETEKKLSSFNKEP